MRAIHDESCSVAACAEIIGAKWTALLVHDLSEGPRRFSELEHSCAGISPRTLSERLRALEDEGIVERRSYAESPPRVEYELTDKGIPTILTGFALPDSNIHSPNENILAEYVPLGASAAAELYKAFGELGKGGTDSTDRG